MTHSNTTPTITSTAPSGDAPCQAAPTPPARHIPWVEFARDLRDTLQSAGKAGVAVLDFALAWASGARPIPQRVSQFCGPNPQRESHGAADALTRERDTVFKVALLQALTAALGPAGESLTQGIAALRHRLATCQQPVPTGLSLDSAVALHDAGAAADRWLNPGPQPAFDQRPPVTLPRLNNAVALCALDHLAARVRTLSDLRMDLLNGLPLAAKFNPGPAGKLIDSNGTEAVALHCQPWLAQLLKFSAADGLPTPPHPWWTLRFAGLKHLGGTTAGTARTDGLKTQHITGLKTANLYYAALVERLRALGQPAPVTPSTAAASAATAAAPDHATPMTPSQALPAGLPAELQDQLPSGLHPVAACSVFALGQSLAGGPAATTDVTALIQGWSGNSRLLKTRRAGTAPVKGLPIRSPTPPDLGAVALGPLPLPRAALQMRDGVGDGPLVSIWLGPALLNPRLGLAWVDVTVLVLQAGRWWVLPVALDDDETDPTRLCLRPLMPWPPGLARGDEASLLQRLRAAMHAASWAVDMADSGGLVCAALALD